MDLSWLGHACFRLRGREVTILTDPYEGADWGYPPLATSAQVVTISNDHPHHAGLSGVEGSPRVLRGPGEYEIGGALIWGVRTLRRNNGSGTPSPKNTAFIIQLEELTVCHLGDLAEAPLSPEELARRQAVVAEIRALRGQIPPISPLTAAELVHLSREDTRSYAEESSSE